MKTSHHDPIANLREQMLCFNRQLREVSGFLNVLNQAVSSDCHFESGDEFHGYSIVVKTAQTIVEETAQEIQDMEFGLGRGEFLSPQMETKRKMSFSVIAPP